MLLISADATANDFPDDRDPQRHYVVPDTLAPLPAAGDPTRLRFRLIRFRGDGAAQAGGVLQSTLALRRAAPPDLPPSVTVLPAPVTAAAARLRLMAADAATVEAAGRWRPAVAATGGALTLTAYLDATETAIIHSLLRQTPAAPAAPAVEIELRFAVPGVRPGVPWTVTTDGAALSAQLHALLPPGPDGAPTASAAMIRAAFLSLPDDLLTFTRTAATHGAGGTLLADPPGDPNGSTAADRGLAERLREEAAWRALAQLFTTVTLDGSTAYRLRSLADSPIGWSMAVPAPAVVERRLTWSVSDLLQDDTAAGHYFPVVASVAPFARIAVHVINALPLDPAALAQVVVELRYRSELGTARHRTETFNPGDDDVRRFETVFPAFGPGLELAYRLTCFIHRPGETPRVWPPERPFVPVDGPVVVIDRAAAGLRGVYVAAESAVFDVAGSLTAVLAAEDGVASGPLPPRLVLDRARPAGWIWLPGVAPGASSRLTVDAHPPAGDGAVRLYDGAPDGDTVMLSAAQVAVLAPVTVTLRLSAAAAAGVVFAAAELVAWPLSAPLPGAAAPPATEAPSGAVLRTFEGTAPRHWAVWPASIFDPPAYAYRLHIVRLLPDGSTAPLRIGPWQRATDLERRLELPAP